MCGEEQYQEISTRRTYCNQRYTLWFVLRRYFDIKAIAKCDELVQAQHTRRMSKGDLAESLSKPCIVRIWTSSIASRTDDLSDLVKY